MQNSVFDVYIENNSVHVKNISGRPLDNCKIVVLNILYTYLICEDTAFSADESKVFVMQRTQLDFNLTKDEILVKIYNNSELVYSTSIKNNLLDRVYILISNKNYETITEQLIAGLSKYSDIPIHHYTVNYNSALQYKNLKNIHFSYDTDFNDQQYMQFIKAPVFLHALNSGAKHAIFLDSDIQVRPNIDSLFDVEQTSDAPIIQKHIHEFVIANGLYIPGPKVREFFGFEETSQLYPQGITNLVIFNKSHEKLFKEWEEVCFSKSIQEIRNTEFLHDELLLNCLFWKNKLVPKLIYAGTNILDDNDVRFFYNMPNTISDRYVNLNDYKLGHPFQSFIPHDKNEVRFFHCVKEVDVAKTINKIIEDNDCEKKNTAADMREKMNEFYSTIKQNDNRIKIADSFTENYISGPFLEVRGNSNKNYDVKFIDKKNNEIVYATQIQSNHWVRAARQYYTDWKIVANDGTTDSEINMDFYRKRVYIHLDSSSLGDTIAWMPYIEEFRKKYNCKVVCSTFWNWLFEKSYTDMLWVSPGTTVDNLYAMYTVGWFYNDDGTVNLNKNVSDFRLQPLQKTASDILGLPYTEIVPKIKLFNNIKKEKLVSIAIHGTAQAKYWNNATGWQSVVDFLKNNGYKVIVLSTENDGYMGNVQPTGVEKLPAGHLDEVIKTLQKSEFFIGIGSGLSWLSWATGTKTVIISGFSEPYTETSTNTIRISPPTNTCTGCFNTHRLDAGDWNWCPLHKNTDRQFECTKLITTDVVIDAIRPLVSNL